VALVEDADACAVAAVVDDRVTVAVVADFVVCCVAAVTFAGEVTGGEAMAGAAAATAVPKTTQASDARVTRARVNPGDKREPFLFLAPTGLAAGLALKESRYAGRSGDSPQGPKGPIGFPVPGRRGGPELGWLILAGHTTRPPVVMWHLFIKTAHSLYRQRRWLLKRCQGWAR
jgi:hypothetical protein